MFLSQSSYLFLLVCRTQVDLGFLIDGSGSVEAYGKGNYRKCLEFVNDLTRAFEISPTDTRIGAIVFSTTSELKFDFIKFTTRQQVENAIKKITYPGRTTNAGQGLLLATDKLFNNVRQGVPRVLVVLTDGRSRDDVVAPSENLKKSGVIIFAVGLGKNYKVEQLKAMASKEFDEHVFTVDFPHISTIITSLQDKLCKGKAWNSLKPTYDVCLLCRLTLHLSLHQVASLITIILRGSAGYQVII